MSNIAIVVIMITMIVKKTLNQRFFILGRFFAFFSCGSVRMPAFAEDLTDFDILTTPDPVYTFFTAL